MTLSVIAGGVRPTSMVGGIRRSGTSRRNFSHAVVGAKEPMPRVSKKLTTAPSRIASNSGRGPFGNRCLRQEKGEEKDRKAERNEKRDEHDPSSLGMLVDAAQGTTAAGEIFAALLTLRRSWGI